MSRYTASHWGIYEVAGSHATPELHPHSADPDPSPIGLFQTHPDVAALRVRRPAVRRGWLEQRERLLRGRDAFVELPWDEALDLVAGEIARIKAAHGNEAIFAGSYGWASAGRFHHANGQVHRFFNSLGGYVRHTDSYSLGAGRVVLPHIIGTLDDMWTQATSWDVMAEHTKLFVAFGGVPAKNAQMTAGGPGRHTLRQALADMASNGARFVNISPVSDNLDVAGCDWIAIRPNTDTALMLALAFELHRIGRVDLAFLARCTVGYDVFRRYLTGETDGQPKTADWASVITGVPAPRIVALAADMADHRTMLNIAWSLQRASHGEQPFWMVITLAAMLGQIGLPGGGFGLGYGAMNSVGSSGASFAGPTLPQGENLVRSFIPVARIADMLLRPGTQFVYNGGTHTYPDIRMIYWAGGNPFHHHQDLNRLEQAWAKPETVIIHEPYWTPTAKRADIVLPVTTTLERADIGFARSEGMMVAMDPVSPRLGEARDDYEIFTALAARLGTEATFTEGRDADSWMRAMYEASRAGAARAGVVLPGFDAFRQAGLVDYSDLHRPRVLLQAFRDDPERHRLITPSGKIEIFSQTVAGFGLADCPGHPVWLEPAEWIGSPVAQRFPLHLVSDQPVRRLHSQLDHSPHSRAGKVKGREPVTVSPLDAAARGIAKGDLVEIFNGRGRCLAAADVSDAIMPGVLRLSTGAWFDLAEDGLETHGNPNAVTLDQAASSLSQGCSAQSCLVELRIWRGEPPVSKAFEVPEMEGSSSFLKKRSKKLLTG